MTVEELKQKIEFRTQQRIDGSVRIQGRVVVTSDYLIDWAEVHTIGQDEFEDLRERLKEQIREKIARQLYADQREELRKAIVELMTTNPMSWSDMRFAHLKVIEAAKFQASDFPGTPVCH